MISIRGKKKSRFVVEVDDIRIIGRHEPTEEELKESEEVFDRLLKDRKSKK